MDRRMLRWYILLLVLWLCNGSRIIHAFPDDVVEMQVKGITMDPHGNTPIVVLKDAKGHQAFPIWIGFTEAQAIVRTMEGIVAPRPLTYVLLQNILRDLDVDVVRIIITDLRNNVFFASILLRQGPNTFTIDARPSDAIALALGVKAPIFVAQKVLGSAGTVTLSRPPIPQRLTKKFGMHLQSLNTNLAEVFHLTTTDGVLVAYVEAGSQAERHGIRRGDVITDVNGAHIKDIQGFLEVFSNQASAQELVLQLLRDQHVRTVRLPLAGLE
ncbi:hypothetical protein NKDENANG_00466 [Candidatus Entotheonellaceae bacterium PAL068K]